MAEPSAELIRGIAIFADLDDSSVKQLSSDFIEREFDAGQPIATEGEGGLNFFVVESETSAARVLRRSARAPRSERSRSLTRPRGRPP